MQLVADIGKKLIVHGSSEQIYGDCLHAALNQEKKLNRGCKDEGREFYIFDQIEAALQIVYGDFRKLPPAEEQICKHMPVQVKL